MAEVITVQVVSGFSLTNRLLLYASIMLASAQNIAGVGSNGPGNLGFLAYNWYTQYFWYIAVKQGQLNALSLLPVHFDLVYSLIFVGGVTCDGMWMSIILGLGTAGLLILNNLSAWTIWVKDLPAGYGTYRFFFFGWRTLTPGWRKFILLWLIFDTFAALNAIYCVVVTTCFSIFREPEEEEPPWWYQYVAILCAPLTLILVWPLILWTELIVSRNHIESQTDMIAVWFLVAQVVALLLPSCALTVPDKGIAIMWRKLRGLKQKLRRVPRDAAASSDIPMTTVA